MHTCHQPHACDEETMNMDQKLGASPMAPLPQIISQFHAAASRHPAGLPPSQPIKTPNSPPPSVTIAVRVLGCSPAPPDKAHALWTAGLRLAHPPGSAMGLCLQVRPR
ncbi:hypothetical protein PTTG_28882 [Puccinia triticina 1-1 BBBD Race 1]|uniref:Uncharacterized protein n=1 Tax=Puccinia triticina (isolate 1-1 / race 1 (BBBD)) TaxID=630390 RepID=A0A180G8M2_PUCT1|nr:hypothetical protein PTTG_28882 [Puccinia triticina 1-1 BBBD Race 1]